MKDVMIFYESGSGTASHFVGKQKEFAKEEFFSEWQLDFKDLGINPTLGDVEEAYCRYYPRMPEGFEIESGYTFAEKGPGAFAVWVIDIQSIRQRECEHDYVLRKGFSHSAEQCRKCQHYREVANAT